MLLGVNRGGKRRIGGKDRGWFLVQTDVMGGPHQGLGVVTQTCAGSACCIASRYIDCASNVISSTYKRYVNNSNQKAQTYG